MPEVLTKHPDVVRQLIEKTGGRCGEGQKQTILKACPPAQFCTMPGGELCIYGVEQARSMTQISAGELREHLCPETAGASAPADAAACGAACNVDAASPSAGLALAVAVLGATGLRRALRPRPSCG